MKHLLTALLLFVSTVAVALFATSGRKEESVMIPRHVRAAALKQRMQTLWAENLPDKNVFDDFDKGYKQPPYKKQPTEKNVFEDFDKGYHAPKYHSLAEEKDENPFDSLPDNYPFNEVAGGHEWHHWDGDSPMDALKEHNVLDTGSEDEAYQIGEHSLGRPFREYKPEKNVLDEVSDDKPYVWGKTDKSIPEKNVLSGLSPDSGYPDE
ncbi:hypothetical protein GUITHDRAFT_162655 [Guillardia theta CCMP2712]|uniref:Uncharacterized protein n=2 Tax=Guillardia theta TaxID=55529 RepID=L1JHL8_GUITC|nr:hypothetical protein GUITHDRAFT_162655 [Guillardia theta CCMP2712]EKX47595.1 hypothetical protein GUITHDRAFT_162655 [Guillardia theta CCMP2712]|mmetsp:Transcript_22580/g.74010  ORF Transcript_22580/g.74010 Transcript_22580/m.74010 type:complete len:208 (+) Transcript_22580:33-656(+)|eukprot:XP_005834575.1 hypothetical protein GUITHDRAFT_162655 [Guillardia theta CCMP2712]